MAIYAAANIAMAIENFKGRGYAKLGGILLNRRNVADEQRKVEELCRDIHSKIAGELPLSQTVQEAEALCKTVLEAFPKSSMAHTYRTLADTLLTLCREAIC